MRHIFIINPAAGKKNITERVRKEIESVCARRGIAPLIFISEYNGYERFIAEKMCSLFTDEDIRFYCIGGSGTLIQTLSGLDDAHNRQITCYPCGLSNDFLKCYVGENRGFRNIENLLDGRVDKIDYIKVSNTCKALDFVSIGVGNGLFETDTLHWLLSHTSSTTAYGLGIAYDLVRNTNKEYEITIDGTDYSGRYALILCMNGKVFGGKLQMKEPISCDDGIMNIFLFHEMTASKATENFIYLYRGKNERIKSCYEMVKGRRLIISHKDHSRFFLNCDGDGFDPSDTTLDIRLVPAGVNFIAPPHSALSEPGDNA